MIIEEKIKLLFALHDGPVQVCWELLLVYNIGGKKVQ